MSRLVLFVLPAILLARTPGFQIKHVWYLSVASSVFQACINLLLLRRELRRKLTFERLENLIPGGATAT
jgi:Na+-driven multidrug efflux pump